jgi:hypothetical protein
MLIVLASGLDGLSHSSGEKLTGAAVAIHTVAGWQD